MAGTLDEGADIHQGIGFSCGFAVDREERPFHHRQTTRILSFEALRQFCYQLLY